MASAADNEHLQITIDTLIERLSAAQRNYRNLQAQCEQERKTWAAQRETYETRLRSFQSIETTVDEQARTLQAQERRIHELESRLAVERESDANLQRKEKSPLKGSDELREGTKAALPNQAARQQACRTLEPLSKVPPTHIPQPTTKALPPSALTLAQAATRPASVPATPSPSATLSRSASSAGITVEPLLSGRVQGALMPAPHLSSPPLTSPPACMPSSDEVACPPSRPAATVPAAPCKTSSPGSTRNPSATSAWDNGLDRLQMNLSKFSDRRLCK
ncbi:hypothetical protein IWQ60_011956 [Tieghemiomyces parasiticus]|uniref:Uncharacterized protein n=1 Tax=Tieghemiomyces parasiticus TaxID=78921 RepID=A0A9W7ZM89_9FUNG|nr:hypothetical protein IWQ60_011956 [Tieghemiomyces parasiticus]